MEIVCATDSCYVMQTGIMLTSLFENNRGEHIRVHLLHDGITNEKVSQIKCIADVYGQQVVFYKMDESRFSSFPIGREGQNTHVGATYATYYRLFLTEVLPPDVNRVIYLDGDIVVMDSLSELWNLDMQGKAIAAVPDSYNNRPDPYNRLHYPQSMGYFNAGVLVLNIEYWRENNVVRDFCECASAKSDNLACHDQDILNYVFRESKLTLHLKYNMLNEYWFDTSNSVVSWEFDNQMRDGQQHPVVVHFTGIPKPWFSNCHHPMKSEYEHYRAMTMWKECKEPRWGGVAYIVEQLGKRLLVMSGLRGAEIIDINKYVKDRRL